MNIKCCCGKLLAKYEMGNIILYCKRCRKEIKININKILEPKSRDN